MEAVFKCTNYIAIFRNGSKLIINKTNEKYSKYLLMKDEEILRDVKVVHRCIQVQMWVVISKYKT